MAQNWTFNIFEVSDLSREKANDKLSSNKENLVQIVTDILNDDMATRYDVTVPRNSLQPLVTATRGDRKFMISAQSDRPLILSPLRSYHDSAQSVHTFRCFFLLYLANNDR